MNEPAENRSLAELVGRSDLQVAPELASFLEEEALPGTGVDPETFWAGFSALVHEFGPRNAALLRAARRAAGADRRLALARRNQPHDREAYKAFLAEIGYLLPEGADFTIETANVDPEIATVPGPQLVVPITNARFALNAANARWGSLYDALYGTDAMGSPPPAGGYDRGRGARVVARARVFLDEAFPLAGTSHADARRYHVRGGALLVDDMPLIEPEKFVGYRGHRVRRKPCCCATTGCTSNWSSTARIRSAAGPGRARRRAAGAAVSAIMDCEDSVACVDAEDKVIAYRNWLGLMRGDLSETFEKGGQQLTAASTRT